MSQIEKRPFDFGDKESYTKLEVQAILGQQDTYYENISKIELEALQTKSSEMEKTLAAYKMAERESNIKKYAKEINADNYEKLVKYSRIAEDADEAAIKAALKATAQDIFQPISTATPKVEVKGEVAAPKAAPKKEYRFVTPPK